MISGISLERLKEIKKTGAATPEEVEVMARYIMSSQTEKPPKNTSHDGRAFNTLPKVSHYD